MAMDAVRRCALTFVSGDRVGVYDGLSGITVDVRHSHLLSKKLQEKITSPLIVRPPDRVLKTFAGACCRLPSLQPVQRSQVKVHLRTILRASQGVDQSEESVSTGPDDSSLRHLKGRLMKSITNTNRGKNTTFVQRRIILKLIEELEEQNPTKDPVDSPLFSGRWALLYTAPVDEDTADKYAGTEEGPFLARVKPAAFGFVKQIRSTQVLDTAGGTAQNIADFTVFGKKGSLNIKGKVAKAAPLPTGTVKVDVTFESFVIKLGDWTSPDISLGWINPKGWIITTYLDADMRVGRGDKGSIFVAVLMTR